MKYRDIHVYEPKAVSISDHNHFYFVRHKALIGLEAIWRNGEVIGFIRRAGYGYHIGKSIAYGYVSDPSGKAVNNEFLKSGEYSIESMGTVFPAQVHLKGLFDQKNERIKGIYN